ncbi:DUF3013 family protein [Loigolactobacillus binensis]|uniref:DUF3013 family protein n=1 Tax=Loigolactobacillus binensis TaxID=2559922 RepID=A0ABW3EFJ4_9LACO|nr:DUF3013 family protein [Loigolactobacillus binensis]
MKITLLDYLATQVADYTGDGQLELNWDKREHVFELILNLTAQNQIGQTIADADGKVNAQNKIDFQDQILFYDATRLDPATVAADYLALIPFDGKRGLTRQTLDGLFSYLPDLLADGLSDLMDFLNEDTVTTFGLHWQPAVFQQRIAAQPAHLVEYLAYPRY